MQPLARGDDVRVGLQLLAEGGIPAVTTAGCCARLGVTKGSFYHHVDGVADPHRAMLEHWQHVHAGTRPAVIERLPPREGGEYARPPEQLRRGQVIDRVGRPSLAPPRIGGMHKGEHDARGGHTA